MLTCDKEVGTNFTEYNEKTFDSDMNSHSLRQASRV